MTLIEFYFSCSISFPHISVGGYIVTHNIVKCENAISCRANLVARDAEEYVVEKKEAGAKWASRPGRGLYRRIIAKDARAVRDFVLDKIILAPGNEVTRALTTRRLIANYESESFPPVFYLLAHIATRLSSDFL